MQEKNRDFSIIKKRILQYLDIKGISKYEFYQKTKISNGILSQKGGLTEDNILKILSYYKEINPIWLLTGEGPMLRQETAPNTAATQEPPPPIPPACPICKEKERIIELQQKTIALLEDQLRECKQSRAKEGDTVFIAAKTPTQEPEPAKLK